MNSAIKILIVQNNAIIADRHANFEKVSKLLKPFENKTLDLIVLPELWNSGWYCAFYPEVAESADNSETLEYLSNLARKFNSNIIGGSYVKKMPDGKLKNTCPVFDRSGKLVCEYDKMHLYSYLGSDEGKYAESGSNPVIADTDIGKIGLSVCYDIRFPELFRKYSLNCADLLLNVAAWPKTRKNHWVTLQKARAIENQSFMIAVSQTGKIKEDEYNLGYSMIVNPYGEIVASLQEEEAVLEYEINLDEMRELRNKIPTLTDIHSKYEFMEA